MNPLMNPLMNPRMNHRMTSSLVALSLALAGCSVFERTSPSTEQFMLVPQPVRAHEGASLGSVVVRRVLVQRPYDTRSFVYHTTNGQWRVDAYNGFLADPSDMIGDAMSRALEGSRRFSLVTSAVVAVPTDLAAEVVVESFHSDYTDPSKPVAVVRMRTYLLERGKGSAVRTVLEGSATQAIASASPGAVAEALSVAVAKAIDQVISQLPKDAAVAAASQG